MSVKRHIVFVVNVDWFFLSHRLNLALSALSKGYKVTLVSKDTNRRNEIESLGIDFVNLDFGRSSLNPFKEVQLILDLRKIYRKLRPDIIHHVTIKPNIYGNLAARLSGLQPVCVNAISGLGYNFIDGRRSVLQKVLIGMMKFAYRYAKTNFIFQNPDDLGFYNQLGLIHPSNHIIIKGAGVDEKAFPYLIPIPKDNIEIVLPARMLYDKGINEFVQAAKILEDEFSGKARFLLVGDVDNGNPASAQVSDLRKMEIPGYIEWVGFRKDMRNVYMNADIVCLPSYREGMPKSLIEAMSIGRPIVTCNVPGCRECVDDGINGFLVPVRDAAQLAQSLRKLMLSEDMRISMGKESREKMLKEMTLEKVTQQTFQFYDKLLGHG